jgi:hypothetical protein
LFFVFAVSSAQIKGDLRLNWSNKSPINIGSQKINVPQFNPKNFQFDSNSKQVYCIFQIPVSSETNKVLFHVFPPSVVL